MEKDRYMVFDHKKGVLLPLRQDSKGLSTEEINEKAEKLQLLLNSLIRQTARETVREYHLQMKTEIKQYEERQEKRWEKMEEHFRSVDECIRQKQGLGKRKKHSLF